MHEHVVIGWGGSESDPRATIDYATHVPRVSEELKAVRDTHGLAAMVDASPSDIGRDTVFAGEVARSSGVHIISSTGLYKMNYGLPPYWRLSSTDELASFFVSEIEDGVGQSGGRCGVIKVATDGANIADEEQKSLRAAAWASTETGVSIITHTDPLGWEKRNVGRAQLEILLTAGAEPDRIAIGHACGCRRIEDLKEICELGAYVALDRVGSVHIRSDAERAKMVLDLVNSGYGDHILLSHDHQAVWRRASVPDTATRVKKDFGLLFRDFLPKLSELGLSGDAATQILEENPYRLLALRR